MSPAPTPKPTISQEPTTLQYGMFEACSGTTLAETKVYMEPNRIWYVGITGSPSEDKGFEDFYHFFELADDDDVAMTNSKKRKLETFKTKNAKVRNVDYKITVESEYGAPTSPPTLGPSEGDPPLFIPSDPIQDPFAPAYDSFNLLTACLFGGSLIVFTLARCYFNWTEKRESGRWMF